MKFMIMLYEQDTDWSAVPKEELERALAGHEAFTRMLRERGIDYYGEAVKESSAAVTLRPRGSDLVPSEGPFTSDREQLAGFYVIDVKDSDEAVELAGHCPTGAGTEIRPVWGSAT